MKGSPMNLLDKLLGRTSRNSVGWLEADALSQLLDGPSPPLIVDVRGPDEFAGPLGHIEPARNIPLEEIPALASGIVEGERPIVVVCHTDRRSAAAAEQLRRAGAADVSVLRGG